MLFKNFLLIQNQKSEQDSIEPGTICIGDSGGPLMAKKGMVESRVTGY